MNTITRPLHSIFNHRKDIVYRRSSSILISVIRLSYCKINLYECPFNIQGRLGLVVAYVAIYVKVSGEVLINFLILVVVFFWFFLHKNRHEEYKGHAMIFMCDKSVKPPFLDRNDGITQQPPSQFQNQTHGLLFIRVLSKNKKKPFGLRT